MPLRGSFCVPDSFNVRRQHDITRKRSASRLFCCSRSFSCLSLRIATSRRAFARSEKTSANHGRLPRPSWRLVLVLSEPRRDPSWCPSPLIRCREAFCATAHDPSQSMDITIYARSTHAWRRSRLSPHGLLFHLEFYSRRHASMKSPSAKP